MPVILFEGPKMTEAQKRELVTSIVTAASRITQIPEPAFTTLITEYDSVNVGVGTNLLADRH